MLNNPDSEHLFRYFQYRDYEERPGQGHRPRNSLFRTRAVTVSVNRGSIWSLEQNLAVAPPNYGLCSFTMGDLHQTIENMVKLNPGTQPLTIIPAPLTLDPLLKIPNPSHANFSRLLTYGEATRFALAASRNIHSVPPPVSQ